MRQKKKVTLKDVKKVIVDDNEDPEILHLSGIKFIASGCGITRDAFKYCRTHKIVILEIGKMKNNSIQILYNPFKKNKFNKVTKKIL